MDLISDLVEKVSWFSGCRVSLWLTHIIQNIAMTGKERRPSIAVVEILNWNNIQPSSFSYLLKTQGLNTIRNSGLFWLIHCADYRQLLWKLFLKYFATSLGTSSLTLLAVALLTLELSRLRLLTATARLRCVSQACIFHGECDSWNKWSKQFIWK